MITDQRRPRPIGFVVARKLLHNLVDLRTHLVQPLACLLMVMACRPNTTDTVTDSDQLAPPCPLFDDGEVIGEVQSGAITEASGLAASRVHEEVWYTHNDSGGDSVVFAMSSDGALSTALVLDGVAALDWEDIAVGPTSDGSGSQVFVGDIGDNSHLRSSIQIHRFSEPTDLSEPEIHLTPTTTEYVYSDGAAHDAEALLVDPLNQTLLIVSKSSDGLSTVYTAGLQPQDGPVTLQEVLTLNVGTDPLSGSTMITAGDISASGQWLLLKTYTHAWIWPRRGEEGTEAWLQQTPCAVPLQLELQGEAAAFSSDETAYHTLSEGTGVPLLRYNLLEHARD